MTRRERPIIICGAARSGTTATDPAGRRHLAESLFDFLEEDIDSGVRQFVEKWPTKLPATHPADKDDSIELPHEWQQLLDADAEYQEMMQAHGY